MVTKYTVYIDEAGDLGINRGTKWFVLTGVIVESTEEQAIRAALKSIKSNLNIQNIHFRKLRNFEQRSYVVNEIARQNFKFINIIIDTSAITIKGKTAKDLPSILTYNFACKMLLERISWLLLPLHETADIILSSRGTSRDKELIAYIKDKLLNYSNNSIYSNAIRTVTSKTAANWDMLQLADICATSIFYCHEINHYGFVIPCYARRLAELLYKKNNSILKYGMKYYSDEMQPNKDYFANHTLCTIK